MKKLLSLALLGFLLFSGCPGPKPPDRPTVVVKICTASNQLAGEFCPAETVADRKFYVDPKPGEPVKPTEICNVHHKPDPPTPSLKVYVGVYDAKGATGDRSKFLRKVKDAGGFGLRLFAGCYSWNGPQAGGSPYKQVGSWTHDNGITFPLYRLAEWDPVYWLDLYYLLREMKDVGLEAWLVVEDYCSLKGDSRTKYYNPMYSSVEALDASTPGGVWGDPMKQYHALLIGKTIQTADASGVDYFIEPVNEHNIVDGTPAAAVAWHSWAVEVIKANGVPISKIVGTSEVAPAAIAAQCGFYSPHGIGRPDQIISPWNGIPASKLIFSSDGFWGGTGLPDAKGRRGVGLDVAQPIAQACLKVGAAFELLPREVYGQNNDRANVDLYDDAVTRMLAFGK